MPYTEYEIKKKAYELNKNFWKDLDNLMSDIIFFKLFMTREAKSSFQFNVRISKGMSFHCFDDLWKRNGYHDDKETVSLVYAEFIVLENMITSINECYGEKTFSYTDEEIYDIISYYEKYNDVSPRYQFFVDDYISDFVGCSYSCNIVYNTIKDIKKLKEE